MGRKPEGSTHWSFYDCNRTSWGWETKYGLWPWFCSMLGGGRKESKKGGGGGVARKLTEWLTKPGLSKLFYCWSYTEVYMVWRTTDRGSVQWSTAFGRVLFFLVLGGLSAGLLAGHIQQRNVFGALMPALSRTKYRNHSTLIMQN